jgi:hypothetical protein
MNRLVARNVEGKSPRERNSKILGEIKVGKKIPEEKLEGILTITCKIFATFESIK